MRRKLLINKKFQFKMILISIVVTIPIYFLAALILRLYLIGMTMRLEEVMPQSSAVIHQVQPEVLRSLLGVTVLGALAIMIYNALIFLFLSHAIVGPIENLKRYLRAKAQNKPIGRYIIRKSDFFADLADEVNNVFANSETKNEKPS